MEFRALVQRAVDVRQQYAEFEERKYGTGPTTPHLHFDVKSGCAPPERLQM